MRLRDGQQVRVLAPTYDSLRLVLEDHMVQGENQLVQIQVVLTSTRVLCPMCTLEHSQSNVS